MQAVWVEKGVFTLTKREKPTPAAHEVLIENVYVAANPKDWKVPEWSGPDYVNVEGNDIAGHVVKVGEGVTRFKVGDKVASFTRMRSEPKYGAYAEFSVGLEPCTFKLGEKTRLEDAVTLPLAAMTAVLALYDTLALPEQAKDKTTVIVTGGSSSVGSFAIQLLKIAGYRIVTTAGGSAQVARDLGADVVIDYRGKSPDELVAALREAAPECKHIFDAATDKESAKTLAKALPNGGTISIILPHMPDSLPDGVEVKQTRVAVAYETRPDFASRWYDQLAAWLEEGKFKGNKPRIMPEGLASVPEGIAMLKANKVSGEKLVYRIADTPKQ